MCAWLPAPSLSRPFFLLSQALLISHPPLHPLLCLRFQVLPSASQRVCLGLAIFDEAWIRGAESWGEDGVCDLKMNLEGLPVLSTNIEIKNKKKSQAAWAVCVTGVTGRKKSRMFPGRARMPD